MHEMKWWNKVVPNIWDKSCPRNLGKLSHYYQTLLPFKMYILHVFSKVKYCPCYSHIVMSSFWVFRGLDLVEFDDPTISHTIWRLFICSRKVAWVKWTKSFFKNVHVDRMPTHIRFMWVMPGFQKLYFTSCSPLIWSSGIRRLFIQA